MRLVFILLVANTISFPIETLAATGDLTGAAKKVLQQLIEESDGTFTINWNEDTNTPALLTGNLSKQSKHPPQWIVYRFLHKTKVLYGLKSPRIDMQVTEVRQTSENNIQVKVQHVLYKTPVWKDELVIRMSKQGVINQVTGRISPLLEERTFHRQMQAAFTKKQAITIALSFAKLERANLEEPKVNMYYLPLRSGTPLIYVVNLKSKESDGQYQNILIHSLTGRVIGQE